MRKATFVFVLAALLSTPILAADPPTKEIGVTYDISYWSKWMTKGFRGYGNQGALFNTVDVDLYDTGLGFKVTHRNATASGYVDKQRFDYRPYFKSKLFAGDRLQTNYNISVGYEHYYGLDRRDANTTWEWVFAFAWPNLCPFGIVPRYIAHYEYPPGTGYNLSPGSGWVHRFGLDYDIENPELPIPLRISAEVAYNDGLGGTQVEHDWSYANFGLSTNIEVMENLTIVPRIFQQISMEDSVNAHKDETYAIISAVYKIN